MTPAPLDLRGPSALPPCLPRPAEPNLQRQAPLDPGGLTPRNHQRHTVGVHPEQRHDHSEPLSGNLMLNNIPCASNSRSVMGVRGTKVRDQHVDQAKAFSTPSRAAAQLKRSCR